MMKQVWILLLGMTLWLAGSGCATMIKGSGEDVTFSTDPPGADVYVDGNLLGRTPMKARMSHDPHTVEFRKEGYKAITMAATTSFSGHSLWLLAYSLIVDAVTGSITTLDQDSFSAQLPLDNGMEGGSPPPTQGREEEDKSAWPDLVIQPDIGGGEDDAVVIVAIEDYLLVPDVPGARQNAEDWFQWFSKSRKTPLRNIILLRDTDATDAAIRDAANKASKLAGRRGTVWFVFIGHGAPSKDQKDGLLVGADAQQSAVGLYSRSVPRGEILTALKKGKQARTVVVMDACFSGRGGDGGALASGLQPLIPVENTPSKGVTIFSAGKADQFAGPLPGAERPAFSYLLLGALQGWGDEDKDGSVTPSEAHNYVRDTMSATVRGRNQTPQLEGGDPKPLSEGNAPAPDLNKIILQ